MTKRGRTVLLSLGVFLVGGVAGSVAGGYATVHFMAAFFGDGSMRANVASARARVVVLQHLRRGETEKAIELLETGLDGDIIGLRVDEEFAAGTNDSARKAIAQAREYRAAYPRTTKLPVVDHGVSKVLDSAPERRP